MAAHDPFGLVDLQRAVGEALGPGGPAHGAREVSVEGIRGGYRRSCGGPPAGERLRERTGRSPPRARSGRRGGPPGRRSGPPSRCGCPRRRSRRPPSARPPPPADGARPLRGRGSPPVRVGCTRPRPNAAANSATSAGPTS